MGNRLSKIYTRTGDKGSTGLGDGSRVDKDSLRVEAYGTTDELNSVIGMILSEAQVTDPLRHWLFEIQHDLFDLGAELCVPGHSVLTDAFVARLEQHIDAMNSELPYLKEFILPGGNRAATTCHLARTVCRRAERRVLTLSKQEPINDWGLKYLNRLSDFLFVAARVLARAEGGTEVMWNRTRFQS
ncbi:MAG: ATP:cob(I)alamin adenosyltransferase [Pseudomonadales bacterium]|jgi:cob(I)alamin adenosyltransferase|uniref:cob(I)yrinic acid a,c-diamide adenosyltransferase n=1 Tax=unclassified Ketobacter TaxID=2639109 RepID=UPI000C4DE563|nr:MULTISPECIES: cob(I)yrinic acid a,c-diamide adenosyltransferase [unclassified Ketobacter]MAA60506.1 ATP:cob(I)alamin adenosyltransferase [Pseudomonadales bacterium]MEC8811238.1 cob(I)yrinic acid a,c-diamide adenosyltransferase [Pseudomonadota bacterium]TNC89071.1 MAG: ATP:cob(I)alamin adenosyltransferase [Alcanivorax sp.]HAG92923.1 cob(I)yrinic acid a,c-diamide adenosyltransferase [Gammaproteobacteria bacterium]MAQ25321.1 ATP:cob(I)alamin adenosyltransferase [Pseudomonadales bacterium]|tara:strand:- start:588 stop:1145 length:558 start_codon:yes stop_codon:yes gene_type:complete